MRTSRASLLATGVVLTFGLPCSAAQAASSRPVVDRSFAIVELKGDPLATYFRTRPQPGRKIDFNAGAVKTYRSQLANYRSAFGFWLAANAPAAQIVGQYDIGLNAVEIQLNGTSLETVRSAPQVLGAEYESLYYPQDDSDPDLAIIHAQQAWFQVGGAANAGRGVKIAIVDSGIDITHPCFSDAGYPAQLQLGDPAFTNNKVVAARVFRKTGTAGQTPAADQSHGTHVAGIAACNLDTPAVVEGVSIPYDVSGVAPAALLGNYNVLPGNSASARSGDILAALEAAYADGFDVANVSLGVGVADKSDQLSRSIDNLDQANMVVAVAAGDEGPGRSTITSPGGAARALTAGASSVPHFVGAALSFNATTVGIATGDFAVVTSDLTAPLGVVTGLVGGLGEACSGLPSGSLTGKIGVISRGGCSDSTKIRNAQAAGAAAAIVVNTIAGDPIAMDQDGTANQPTIPAYMAALADRASLAASDGQAATISAALFYIQSTNVDIMAGASGRGPFDFRVKPDVVAPGVNVLSSIPQQFCDSPPCWAFSSGTSSATPHLAGSAAVVRGAHPTWSAGEIRSAIVNTADQGVLRDFQTGSSVVTDVNIIGAGRENLLAAVEAIAALEPVSASFGVVKGGQTRNTSVVIRNLTFTSKTFALSLDTVTGTGVTFAVSPNSVTLAAGQAASLTFTMSAVKSAGSGDRQSTLRISSGGVEVAHAAVYAFVK